MFLLFWLMRFWFLVFGWGRVFGRKNCWSCIFMVVVRWVNICCW